MKSRNVVVTPEAEADLLSLYDWIAEAATPEIALAYIDRIETFCQGLSLASERGQLREDIRPGLRVVGFRRRIAIAFTVSDTRVTILRIFYGGRNWERLLSAED